MAAFYGASELLTHKFLEPRTLAPLIGGLALIVVLIVSQARSRRPPLPIGNMLSSTIPVAGIVIALFAAAASVSATVLTANLLASRYSPIHPGLLCLPELAGAVVGAFVLSIDEAGKQLEPGRDALVLCVWQPFDVGFLPSDGLRLDATQAGEVRMAAEQTAADGAALAEAAGFRALSGAVEESPTWKAIVNLAEERDASLIVLGSHGRTRIPDVLLGSVAGAVAAHARRSALIVHRPT